MEEIKHRFVFRKVGYRKINLLLTTRKICIKIRKNGYSFVCKCKKKKRTWKVLNEAVA